MTRSEHPKITEAIEDVMSDVKRDCDRGGKQPLDDAERIYLRIALLASAATSWQRMLERLNDIGTRTVDEQPILKETS